MQLEDIDPTFIPAIVTRTLITPGEAIFDMCHYEVVLDEGGLGEVTVASTAPHGGIGGVAIDIESIRRSPLTSDSVTDGAIAAVARGLVKHLKDLTEADDRPLPPIVQDWAKDQGVDFSLPRFRFLGHLTTERAKKRPAIALMHDAIPGPGASIRTADVEAVRLVDDDGHVYYAAVSPLDGRVAGATPTRSRPATR
jgi:hypothetical protein